jgi:ABC-type molybdenum transport system ATPase subunit/photorepair protein PhrA
MIVTRSVTKRYGSVLAVDGIDLDVRPGDRYGLLGPNGSGKTTLVRMLLGLVYASSGQIEVLGKPVPRKIHEVLPEIGALVEEPAAYPHLSGRANLRLFDAAGSGGAGSRTRWSRSGWPASTGDQSRRTRWACASGSAWLARWCANPGCWSWTNRATASIRAGSAISASCSSS